MAFVKNAFIIIRDQISKSDQSILTFFSDGNNFTIINIIIKKKNNLHIIVIYLLFTQGRIEYRVLYLVLFFCMILFLFNSIFKMYQTKLYELLEIC